MRNIKEIIVRTHFPNTISGNESLIERLKGADIVKVVDFDTLVVVSTEDPKVLLSHARQRRSQNRSGTATYQFYIIPFTPGNQYAMPKPKPAVKLRKAKR